MFDDEPETEDEVQFRIEMIRDDIQTELGYIKDHGLAVAIMDAKLTEISKNLKFLKTEAPVVSLVDYVLALSERDRLKENRLAILSQVAKNQLKVKALNDDLTAAERLLERTRKSVSLATILEFPNAYRGRDPEPD